MDESIFVSSIIDKLPPSWKDFKHTLKHGKDDLSLVQLGSHLRIEESSLRVQDSDKGNGKEVAGPSVNMTEESKNKNNTQNKGKKRDFKEHVVKTTTQMLVVREKGQRTIPKTKVDAIVWRIDSSATTYVCKDRCWFKTYELVEDGYVLYMGDDHFAHVHGKGSVVLEFSSGKSITLFNVLYVPKLSKNLISGPVLNKCGYKQVYESDKYILSKCGVFVGFGYYNNAPYTPQQNGVAERKNRALKEMVNSMLSYSGMNEGFWGEAMLMACYLLNRVPNKRNKATPYELWYKKRPNLSFLRVWSCRAVVRLPNPKRKTLGKKSIDCIFVGYVEHSKAYRFYVIEPNDSISVNSIIESIDGIFDENRLSSIPRPNDFIPNVQESQMDDHTDDVPNEIPKPRKGCKWIFKRKIKVDGTIDKFKDRLTTFLNGDLEEEMYMKQPEGFVMRGNEHKTRLNVRIRGRFSMKSHYIEKILKKFNREDCSPVSTPMDPVEKFKPNTRKPVDQLEYSRAIGCLMYAVTSTRPDIAYIVGRLSRFTSNPSRQDWKAITKVFKYLRGTKDYGLSYVGYPLVLKGYLDATWINHVEDSASTSGWVFLLEGGAISWASKKQTCITSSTMESEFVALAAAGKEAEWLRNLIHEISILPKPIAPISI
uniref:Zinc finger, CCHC-type n=1 Tax=Tanacetum cinerariifolium TaxID=118510 RepID=A0A699H300_TANCI|nr:zinc finger, CCHC-type [Tanacetum cinerariifolium]